MRRSRGDHRAEGRVAGGDALGAGDDVRLVAVPLRAEHVAEPAERADHLVADQEHVVLVADLADPVEVSRRRREAAAGVLDRLQEDRRDRFRSLVLDRRRDLVGGPEAELLLVVLEVRRAVVVRVRHPERRGDERLERRLHARQAGDREGALRRPVVGDRPADHLVLVVLAGELEVVLGELPRGLDGLAATGGEEDPVEVARRVVGHPLGELDRVGVGVGPDRHERQPFGLLRGGLGQLRAPVAELAHEQAGEPVEVALPVDVVDVGTLAADDDRNLGVVMRRVPGEVHPQVLTCLVLQAGIVVGDLAGHGYRFLASRSVFTS